MKKLEFDYQMKLTFSHPVTDHKFQLRCIPATGPRQQIVDVEMSLEPDTKLEKQIDSFDSVVVTGTIPEPHEVFSYHVSGIAFVDNENTKPEQFKPLYRFNSALTCSLERHCREYAGNAPAYIYYKSTSNRWETVSKKATLLDGIADERWDVVVLQQASGKSGIYPTYQPWFGRLVEIVRWCCPNAGACIAWQQTWAYARNSQHRDFGRYEKNQQLMYRGIVSSVEQLMRETSVEVVVPSGTAIQDLRNTALCDSLDLTRDGYHLNPGTGRYTAACAWFQTLVAPAFG